MKAQKTKNESPLLNLFVNVVLPVMILNWSGKWDFESAPELGLALGLIPPLTYGMWDWLKNHNRNGLSALGVINVLFTGGLAVLDVEPYWFVVKEAFFPFILGAAIFISEKVSAQAFFEKMFRQADALDWARLDEVVARLGRSLQLKNLLKNCNRLFATSFMISSALNYWLADRIFRKLPGSMDLVARKQILNEQIAEMTWKGYLVIALPLMLFMAGVLWYLFRNLKKISGLEIEELMKTRTKT